MKKVIYLLSILVLLIVIGFFLMNQKTDDISPVDQSSTQNRMMSIENYVKLYISELSPVEEVLGGRFYVTSIEVFQGKGVVSYEDGHNAFTADFTYTEKDGSVTVTSFNVRD